MKTTSVSKTSAMLPLALLLALAVLPFIAHAIGEPFYVAFFARIIIYAIAASALNLALGYGGLVSFGHSLFLGLGAYSVALPDIHGISNGWVHLALCLALCGSIAWTTGIVSLRTNGIAFIMITLAFAQMGYFFFISMKQYGGDDGLSLTQNSRFGPLNLGSTESVYGAALLILALSTWWLMRLRSAPFGMTLRAARQNPQRVNAAGLPVRQYQLAAYVLSGMLCGVAGLLLANLNAFASPSTMAWTVSGELILIVVVGGIGTVAGPLLGAIVLLGLEEILKSYTEHWMAIFGLMILTMALAGRAGLSGLLQALGRARAARAERTARASAVWPASSPGGER